MRFYHVSIRPSSFIGSFLKITTLEIIKHNTGNLTARLQVKVAPEDYKAQVDDVLKDYARRANIKGFRPGKVPVSVVRKMFGKGVIFEELNKVISGKLSEYIATEKISLVGEPLPISKDVELDAETDASYEFEYELGLAPDFSINYGLAGEAPLYKVSVDDEILAKEIEDIRERNGDMTNPEESEPGDTLYGKLIGAGREKMFALNPSRISSEALKAEMGNGKKDGDKLTLTMDQVFENDNAIRRFWETNVQNEQIAEISDEELAEIKAASFTFEVRKINRVTKIDLGEDLYAKVFGEEHGIADADAFRERVRQDMEVFFNREAGRYFRSKAIRSLVEGSDLPLPDDFLRDYLVKTREQVTADNIDEIYPSYSRSMRWRLLIEKMQSADDSVKVNQDDLRARAREMVLSQFGSLVSPDDTDRLDSFANYYLKDEKMAERMFDELLEDRVFAHITARNPPVEDSITATAFMDLLKSEN
jgi:trigger factor